MRIYSLILILTLSSCSANYHYRKALKKGLEPLKTSDTIRVSTIDSIPVIKNDTIVYNRFITQKDTVIQYKNVYVPKTRLEIRTEYKIKRDTIRLIKRVEAVRARSESKAKRRKPINWTLIIIAISLILGALFYVKTK